MKQPREEVPPPDFDLFEEEEGDAQGLPSEEEKKLFQELRKLEEKQQSTARHGFLERLYEKLTGKADG